MRALKLFRCAVYMAKGFVSVVLTVRVSITPSIEMKALPVVASTFFHGTDSVLLIRAVDLVRAISAVLFMVTAPSARDTFARLATEV